MRVYRSDDTESAEIRARLVRWVAMLTPWLAALNIGAALALASRLPAPIPDWLRWSWCGCVCALWAWGVRSWLIHRGRAPGRARPHVVQRSVVHAAVLAALWALLPWSQFPEGNRAAQVMIAGVMPSMVAGGGFVLAPIAPAAMAFALIIGGSSCIAIAHYSDPMAFTLAGLMAAFTVTVAGAVLFGARRAAASLLAERSAVHQRQLVGMLLRDFESQSSDVLWEIDARGFFVRVSPKLLALMRLDGEAVGDQNLLGWFESRCRASRAAPGVLVKLREAFAAGQAFRLRDIPIAFDDAQRWWALTARPLHDESSGLQGWRGVITDITLEHDTQSRIEELSLVDTLTGLANRMQLRNHLQARLAAATHRPAALLCLNMDHFKRINDLYGHAAGDTVLREAARRLKTLARSVDLVARVGGDEFALMVEGVDAAGALRFGQRVVGALARGFTCPAGAITSGASVGVAMLGAHGTTVDGLLANAELALEAAKKAGGGRCELFHEDMGERLRQRVTLERDLRRAVARGELRLHWQPKVDTAAWKVNGCEALLRWQHPELGLVPPMQFVPLAEETGLIVELGEWVLHEACEVGARSLPGLSVAVNASPAQVVREDFVEVVCKALAAGGLPAQRLEIEITESLFIDASPQALRNLEALRGMGVRVALDDFGTGYSSLAYLRQFPFDTLKIDRAFVRELVTRHDARAIVRSIVELATALGMSTVAEGVEEPEQYELLRRARCTAVQGYLIAKPMPIKDVVELLESWAMERAPHSDGVPDSIFADDADESIGELGA